MVDIHSHILPGWDDGSRSMEESLEMLRIASDSGTTDIVATPHANTEFPFNAEIINALYADLKARAAGVIQVHLGCDFHIQFENVQDALSNPTKYTINHGPYLMVELPDIMNFNVIRDIMARLRDVGIVSVITHPERNMQLQSQPLELKRWVEDGVLIQVTGQSLLGRFGGEAKNCANHLMKADLVHVIASDAHDTQDRTPRLSDPYKLVESRFGAPRAERLFRLNPEAIVHGVPTLAEDMEPEYQPRKRRWAFWEAR